MNDTSKEHPHPLTTTTSHPLQHPFFSTFRHHALINCTQCARSIAFLTHIVVKGHHMCVGCFGKSFQNRHPYSVISYGRKPRSLLSLAKNLELLKAVEKDGVDNIQQIREDMKIRVSSNEVRMFIQRLARKPVRRSNKKQPAIQNKSSGEVRNDLLKMRDTRATLQDNKLRSYNLLIKHSEKQYQLSDHFLASLHQNTDENTVHFLTNFKIRQMRQNQQISTNIKKILSSLADQSEQLPIQNVQASQYSSLSKELQQQNLARSFTPQTTTEQQILLDFKALADKAQPVHIKKKSKKDLAQQVSAKLQKSKLFKGKKRLKIKSSGQKEAKKSSRTEAANKSCLNCTNSSIKGGLRVGKQKMIKKANARKSISNF